MHVKACLLCLNPLMRLLCMQRMRSHMHSALGLTQIEIKKRKNCTVRRHNGSL